VRWTIEDAYDGNLGHSGGHKYLDVLPENSLQSLRASIQFQHTWRYLEIDIRETADNKLVVFHDSTLHGEIPGGGANAAAAAKLADKYDKSYDDLKVAGVTLAEMKSLHLAGVPGFVVPTLEEFLDECRKLDLTAPVALELKDLRSGPAREDFLDVAAAFKAWHAGVARPRAPGDGWDFPSGGDDLVLLGFPTAAYSSLPGGWGGVMHQHGLRFFRAREHDTEFFVPLADTDSGMADAIADVKATLKGQWKTVSGSKYFTGSGVLTIHDAADGSGQLEFHGHDYGTKDDGIAHILETVTREDGVIRPEVNLKRKGTGKNDHIFTLTSETEMSGWALQHGGTWKLRKV